MRESRGGSVGRHEWACFAAHQPCGVITSSVRAALAEQQQQGHPDLLAVGVVGSYGRGEAGVGSDLDLLLILRECSEPIWDRLRRWDTGSQPLAQQCKALLQPLEQAQLLL